MVLLGSIFFAKGVNPPFGSVFEWLVNNIFIFELIRTPDTKIGIIILIVISILLLMLIGRIKDYFFYLIIIPIIVVCIIYNAIPILNKEAPLGINSKYLSNSSYVTVLGKDELAIINYLNEDSNSNVFPIPGQYALHSEIDKSIFAHRDIIANNVKNPFFYREMSEVSDYRVANAIEQFFIYKNIESLDYLNIKYILIKKNVIGKVGGEALIFSELVNLWKNESKVKLAVTTESYDLFEIINPPVATKNNNIKFIEVTPYREVLEIYNQHGWVTTIEKFGSYNSNWLPILISNRCDGYWYRICFYDGLYRSINSDLFINISDPNAENPKNVWRLNVSNELFKETLRVEIFYIPQFLLFLIIIFTFFAFSLIIIFVIIKNIRINEK
ncbi:hypothetical protein PHIN9_03100 [Polynucleobacter sp. HIN9]|nr:hypothetical protein PHIN9_03100 [Polynucleobacter sp. HIN9]